MKRKISGKCKYCMQTTLVFCILLIPIINRTSPTLNIKQESPNQQESSSDISYLEFNTSKNTLSKETKEQINTNHEINRIISEEIILGIDSGESFGYNWEYSLDATYFGLSILQALNRLDLVNSDSINSYIMSLYHPLESNFYDNANIYLNYSIDDKIGYSKVEATAYAILCLDIIGKLNALSQSQKDAIEQYLLSAINPQDGGFYHRTDGQIASKAENSSIFLSYVCYNALVRLDPSPLTSIQIQNLAEFVSLRQKTTLPGIPKFNGAFNDGVFLYKPSLTAAYYAVSLLSDLNMLNTIDTTILIEHVESMESVSNGGIFMSYFEEVMCDNASFSSTAIGIFLGETLGWVHGINIGACLDYIIENMVESRMWTINNGFGIKFLSEISLIVKCFIGCGNLFSVSEIYTICEGIQSYLRQFGDNMQAFSLLSNIFGNIIDISEKLKFLEDYGTLDDVTPIQIEKIINFTDSCLDLEESNLKYYKFPELIQSQADKAGVSMIKPYFLGNIPMEIIGGDSYDRGLHCTYAALNIYELLGQFDHLETICDASELAIELNSSQFASSVFTGGFYPYSDIKSSLESNPTLTFLFESPMLSYYAVKALKIIEDNNNTIYLSNINISALKTYFNSMLVTQPNIFYFNISIRMVPFLDIDLTYFAYEMNEILNSALYDTSENVNIFNWLNTHSELPIATNQDFDISSSAILVKLMYVLNPECKLSLNMNRMREVYADWFGNTTKLYSINRISNEQLRILRLLLDEIFIEVKFYEFPEVHLNFTPIFKISAAGISEINFLSHDIDIMIMTDNYFSPWIQMILSASQDYYSVEVTKTLDLSFFPSFELNIRDIGLKTPQFDTILEIPCYNDIRIDLGYLKPILMVDANEIIPLSIGIYQDNGESKKPIEISSNNISIAASDSNWLPIQDFNCTIGESTIVNNQTWINFNINSSSIANRSYITIEIENTIFVGSAEFVNTNNRTYLMNVEEGEERFKIQLTLIMEPVEQQKSMNSIIFFICITIGGVYAIVTTQKEKLKEKIKNKTKISGSETEKESLLGINLEKDIIFDTNEVGNEIITQETIDETKEEVIILDTEVSN